MLQTPIPLNNGNSLPGQLAFGTYDIPCTQTATVVHQAALAGYRHFDTAVLYGNECEVGQGLAQWLQEDPSHSRKELFYTTKLWNSQLGYAESKRAIRELVDKVPDLRYIDLVLIHSPLPGREKRLGSWRALQEAVEKGLVRNIGVSNYGKHHIEELFQWPEATIRPCVNQIEISPWCMRLELAAWCQLQGIVVEAYAPLTHGLRLASPLPGVAAACKIHGVSPAQVLIRWLAQKGYVPVAKTKTPARLRENFDVYSFALTEEEMDAISEPNTYDPTDWECTDAP